MPASSGIISTSTAFPSEIISKFSGLLSMDFDGALLTGDCELTLNYPMNDINLAATQITSFTADFIPSISNYLVLPFNDNIISVSLASITSIGYFKIYDCDLLQTVSLPNLQLTTIEDIAIYDNQNLISIDFSSLISTNRHFAVYRTGIQTINLPEFLNTVGAGSSIFLFDNHLLTSFSAPKLTVLGIEGNLDLEDCFELSYLDVPMLTSVWILNIENTKIITLDLPSLQTINYPLWGLSLPNNHDLYSVYAPNLISAPYFNFIGCSKLTSIDLRSLQSTDGFYVINTNLSYLNLDSLTNVKGGAGPLRFDSCSLPSLNLPLLQFASDIIFEYSSIKTVNLPSLFYIQDNISGSNSLIESFYAPSLTYIGGSFIMEYTPLNDLNLDLLENVVNTFNVQNCNLVNLYLPNLFNIFNAILFDISNNPNLLSFSAPLLSQINGLNSQNNNQLSTINLNSLTSSTSDIDLSYNNLLDLQLPYLTTVLGYLKFTGNSQLQNIYAPLLTLMSGDIELNNSQLQSANFSSLISCNNIYLQENQLTSVDFSKLTSTSNIYLYSNKLSELYFPKLFSCNDIIVDRNPFLSIFQTGMLVSLHDLIIFNGNLTVLDLPSLHSVTGGLYAQNNQINIIDISAIHDVADDLNLSSNQIVSLTLNNLQTVGKNFTFQQNDQMVSISTPSLTSISGGIELILSTIYSIDLSLLTEVQFIHLNDNPFLNSVDLSSLEKVHGDINIYKTSISSLVMNNLILCEGEINIYNNELTTFEISSLTIIDGPLSLYNNKLTTLDLSSLQEVEGIYASGNEISSIDLTSLTASGDIEINNNQITSLLLPSLLYAGSITAQYGNLLTTFSAPLLRTINSFTIHSSSIDTIDLSLIISAQSIDLQNNNLLTSILLSQLVLANEIIIKNNRVLSLINLDSLDQVLIGDFDLYRNALAVLNLDSLAGVMGKFDISRNPLVSLSAPLLGSTGDLIITSTNLVSLSLDSLGSAGEINLRFNSLIDSISFPVLNSALNIRANGNGLTSIDLTNLVSCYDLDLSNNQLTSVTLDFLLYQDGETYLYNNPNLSYFSATSLEYTSKIFISDSQITSITLDALITIQDLYIFNNPFLNSLSFPSLTYANVVVLHTNLISSIYLPLLSETTFIDLTLNQLINLDLPLLSDAGNNFWIDYNPTLISINAPMLNSITAISLPNGVLQSVNLPLLSTCSLIDFSNNEITSINLNSLSEIDTQKKRSLTNGLDLSNNLLTSLHLDQLISIVEEINLSNNPFLSILSLPLLQSADNIIIHKTLINSISLPSLTSILNLNIRSNNNLNSITANILTTANEITIVENFALSSVSFNSIQTIFLSFSIISSSISSPLSFPLMTSAGSLQINNNINLPNILLFNGISVGFPIDLQNNQLTTVPNFLYQISSNINQIDISNNKFRCEDLPQWCSSIGANCFPCIESSLSPTPSVSPSPSPSPSPSSSNIPLVFLGPDVYSLPPIPSPPPLLSTGSVNIGGNGNGNGIEGGNYYSSSSSSSSNTFLQAEAISENGGKIEIEGFGYITFSSNSFSSSIDSLLLISLTSSNLVEESDFRNSENQTVVIDISILGSSFLISSLNICFYTDIKSTNDKCLGYIDESVDPPTWKCEDRCLERKNSSMCGKTSHLTSFAVLFQGIANNDGGECGDNKDYILGSYDYDLVLSASVAGFVILLAIIFIFVFCFTPLEKYALGKEGNRIHSLRRQSVGSILAD